MVAGQLVPWQGRGFIHGGIRRFPLGRVRPLSGAYLDGLARRARAAADIDAAAAFPDAEIGETLPPFEHTVHHLAVARGERIGRGHAHSRIAAGARLTRAEEALRTREQAVADAAERVRAADMEARQVARECAAGPGEWRRRFAHLGGAPIVRAAVLTLIILGEGFALKRTMDVLGAPEWQTSLLVAVIVFAGLLVAVGFVRFLSDDDAASGPVSGPAGGLVSGPGEGTVDGVAQAGRGMRRRHRIVILTGLVVVAVANVYLARVRATIFVLDSTQLSRDAGLPVLTGYGDALGLFLGLQALFTFAAFAYDLAIYDQRVEAVRRAARAARTARVVLRHARWQLVRANARAAGARAAGEAVDDAHLSLLREDHARFAFIRDTYRAALVAVSDVDTAAAVAALPRHPFPLPDWALRLRTDGGADPDGTGVNGTGVNGTGASAEGAEVVRQFRLNQKERGEPA